MTLGRPSSNKILKKKKKTENLCSEFIESREPCDYCTDRFLPGCRDRRTELFPDCFNGKRLRP